MKGGCIEILLQRQKGCQEYIRKIKNHLGREESGNMKRIKRLSAIMLAVVMTLAMAMTTFGVTPSPGSSSKNKGSITIKNPVEEQTYKIYRMFELESYNAVGAYSYKITEAWRSFVETGSGKDYFSIDAQDYVTLKSGVSISNDSPEAVEMAKAAKEYAKNNSLEADAVLPENGSYTASDLLLGYYLVDSSLGALCDLTTTNPAVIIQEKNSKPDIEKKVQEETEWEETNDGSVGDTVNFKITVTAQPGAENYIVHDKMDDGLTYTGITKITLNGVELAETEDGKRNYEIINSGDTEDGCTFEVRFDQDFCSTLNAADTIVIYYTATINEYAVTSTDNENVAKLTYGDSNSVEKKTKTKTWELNVYKYTETDTEIPLSGAVFTLSKDAEGADLVHVVASSTLNEYIVCTKDDSDDSDTSVHKHVTEITTDGTGKIAFLGLDSGTYYLNEIVAPNGYNLLKGSVEVKIGSDGTVTYKSADAEAFSDADPDLGVKVLNNTGAELPSTGGMGTAIFYILGSLLVLGAGVILFTRKRMNKEQ